MKYEARCIRYVSRFLEKATEFFYHFLGEKYAKKQQKLLKMTNRMENKFRSLFTHFQVSDTMFRNIKQFVLDF